jgi:hypothetical protein
MSCVNWMEQGLDHTTIPRSNSVRSRLTFEWPVRVGSNELFASERHENQETALRRIPHTQTGGGLRGKSITNPQNKT